MIPAPDEGQPGETKPFKVLSPGTTISHYRIIEKIGEGGMGIVYKSKDTRLDRTVALKLLPPHLLCDSEARERFEHEAKAASALNHPNIATIFEIDEEDGRCFIAMEFLEGGSLKGLLKAKDLSMKEILDLTIQIGEGLNAAHESGVTHRDIKPDNIMLTRKGRVKITDFGLAKLRGATRVTKTGTTLGTLQYMSPEQAGGKGIDSRSDIFSFGVILYEMITGKLPFKGDNEAAVISSILNDTPEPLARYKSDLPEGFQRIVERALTKNPSERYQHADDMAAELRHEKRLLETGASKVVQTQAISPASRRRILPILIPAAIAAAAIILIFIFEPFRIEVGPGQEASAQENTLAIMYFENLTDREDPEKLAEIITALLITDLSESQYMNVVSSQRLYDILKLLGQEGTKVVDRDMASEVATKAGAKWMLLGSILRTAPEAVIATQLVNVESGTVEASQRITGGMDEDVFSLVDRLSVEIKEDLSLPAASREEPDRPVADVTTHSPEAYRYYLEGRDYQEKYLLIEAMESYRKALEFDSTFAMAYYRLSERLGASGSEREEMTAKALEYSDNASWKERLYIKAQSLRRANRTEDAIQELKKITERYPEEKEAFLIIGNTYHYRMGRPEQAIPYYGKAIETDPLDGTLYNEIAYAYEEIGDFEKSIWAINKYISLAPDEVNPYDSRGDLYAWHDKVDLAIASYRKALEIKTDFYMSRAKLGHMYLFRREYTEAEACYQELCSSREKEFRSRGRTYLALIPLYRGKLERALEVLDDAIAADQMERAGGRQSAIKQVLRACIHEEKKDLDLALDDARKAIAIIEEAYPEDPAYMRDFYVHILAESGKLEEAHHTARALKSEIGEENLRSMGIYWAAMGAIELAEGNHKTAVDYLEKVPKTGPSSAESLWEGYFLARLSLAGAYLKSERLGEAVAELENALSRYDESRAATPISAAKAYYLLGLAYEKSGWNTMAAEQYEEFLDIWKDADPGLPEIEDARRRLARLKSGT